MQIEVFDILFVKEMDKKHVVHCLNCARKITDSLSNFVILEEYEKNELLEIYDKFVVHVPAVTTASTSSLATSTSTTATMTTASITPSLSTTTVASTAAVS